MAKRGTDKRGHPPGQNRGIAGVEIKGATHPGEGGRNNEDNFGYHAFYTGEGSETRIDVAVVADGIGGHEAGEEASRTAVDECIKHLSTVGSGEIAPALRQAFSAANQKILAQSLANPAFQGMGTTMTCAVVKNGKLYLANIGDSRAYLIRDNKMQQLTIDHTWAQEAIEAGTLTPAQARVHPNRNVIKRYLGILADAQADLRIKLGNTSLEGTELNQGMPLLPGDTIVLCTDGLTDVVEDDVLLSVASKYEPELAAQQLIQHARDKNGQDNVTAVVIEAPGGAPKKQRVGAPIGRWIAITAACLLLIALSVFAFRWLTGTVEGDGDQTGAPATESAATALVLPTATPTATETPSPASTSTHTPAPTVTATATQTVEATAPAAGNTPTTVPSPTPTFTRVPPTRTPTLTPTAIVVPPTNTPVPPSGPGPSKPKPTATRAR